MGKSEYLCAGFVQKFTLKMKKNYCAPLIHEIGMMVEAGSAVSNGDFSMGFDNNSTRYENDLTAED